MIRGRVSAMLALVVIGSVLVTPDAGNADGRRSHDRARHRPAPRGHHSAPPVLFVPGPVVRFSAAPPVVHVPYPVYVPQAVVYPPAATYHAAASLAQRVVEYPGGRYELRGDGVVTPYAWVWIPNPPSAAPASPDPPPASVPARPEPPSPDPPPASAPERPGPPAPASRIYRWIDEAGVTNLTDDLNRVPERYRVQVSAPPPGI